jgi:hypothetical protein
MVWAAGATKLGRRVAMTGQADVRPKETFSTIAVPSMIDEETGLQGFAFSHRLVRESQIDKYARPRTATDLRAAQVIARKSWELAEAADGGPGVAENYIRIKISNAHANAGSDADKIYLYFGNQDKYLRLWGLDREGERFPRGWTLTWDMNGDATSPRDWIETVPTDAWDDVLLVTKSGDGMLIDNITLVHSGITILDWPPPGETVWLDGSRGEKHSIIGLADQILQKKLAAIDEDIRWVPQLHYAVCDLGKTDGKKYGTTHDWCSEFSSWCLRKAGWWDAPKPPRLSGNIGSGDMERYFEGKDRKYTKDQLIAGDYRLTAGDYLRFNNHSALFVRYQDDGRAVTDPLKRFESIDGNWGAKVTLANGGSREIRDLISVGCAR